VKGFPSGAVNAVSESRRTLALSFPNAPRSQQQRLKESQIKALLGVACKTVGQQHPATCQECLMRQTALGFVFYHGRLRWRNYRFGSAWSAEAMGAEKALALASAASSVI
jgi:hypothetical protein